MIIGIGFDGTCVTHAFPNVGINIGAGPVLRALTANGHELCLLTNRCDVVADENGLPVDKLITKIPPRLYLQEATKWFTENNIPLKYVNFVPEQRAFTSSTRCFCNIYIEWNNLFTPIEKPKSGKPYVSWLQIFAKLISTGVINNMLQPSISLITEEVMDEMIKASQNDSK